MPHVSREAAVLACPAPSIVPADLGPFCFDINPLCTRSVRLIGRRQQPASAPGRVAKVIRRQPLAAERRRHASGGTGYQAISPTSAELRQRDSQRLDSDTAPIHVSASAHALDVAGRQLKQLSASAVPAINRRVPPGVPSPSSMGNQFICVPRESASRRISACSCSVTHPRTAWAGRWLDRLDLTDVRASGEDAKGACKALD